MKFRCWVCVDSTTGGGKHVDMLISFIKLFVIYMSPPQVVYYITYEYITQGPYFLNSPL